MNANQQRRYFPTDDDPTGSRAAQRRIGVHWVTTGFRAIVDRDGFVLRYESDSAPSAIVPKNSVPSVSSVNSVLNPK